MPKTAIVTINARNGIGVVGPTLGQDLADQVVGNEIVAQTEAVRENVIGALHHRGKMRSCSRAAAGDRRPADVATDSLLRRLACSAFRSQQVSGFRSALVVAFSSV